MTHGGRPLGAKGSKQRRQWERDQVFLAEQIRIEELDSGDSDGVGSDFILKRRHVSDSLQFTGIDLGAKTRQRRSHVYEPSESGSSGDDDDGNESAAQVALRKKESRLVESAFARIQRAKEKGKKDVKLHEEEAKALERHQKRLQEEEARKKKRSSSSGRRRSNSKMVTVPLAAIEPRRRSGKREEDSPYLHGKRRLEGPGLRLANQDGSTSYTPIGVYPSSSGVRNSRSRPRSSSSLQAGARHTPPVISQYQPYRPGRYVSDGLPPTSSSVTRRFLPDEEGWIRRQRQSSGSPDYSDSMNPFDYQVVSDSAQHSPRRGASGPADVLDSNVARRVPVQAGYPSASRNPYVSPYGPVPQTSSDPSLNRRMAGEIPDSDGDEETSSASDSDMGHGVLVDPPERDRERPRERSQPIGSSVPSRKPVGAGVAKKKGGRK